jgi:multiple sugar transport system permease protein
VVLLLVFEVFAILHGAYISACDWRLQCTQFIGFDNYTRALSDSALWHALLVTGTYALISVPLQLGLGLWIAYLLYQKVRGQGVFRVLFFCHTSPRRSLRQRSGAISTAPTTAC